MANAEFIVRACNSFDDMLAALKAMAEDAEAQGYGGYPLIAAAHAAIAKATGQS